MSLRCVFVWSLSLALTNVGLAQSAGISCVEVPGAVEIRSGDKLILRYNTAVVEPPAGLNPAYRRSGHIHPLNTPSGRTVTAEFPADHAHQHGVFFAWVNTEFKGHKVDFWNQAGLTGTVGHEKLNRIYNDGSAAGFTATLHHVDITNPDKPEVVLEEEWTLTAYPPTADGYLFDLVSTQFNVSDAPLILQEYHYGGMAFRGNVDWLDKQSQCNFLTSEGKTRKDGNHSRPTWVNISGLLSGEMCGLTIFSHPGNLRAPQPVRLHDSKPYFVFAPEVLGPHKIFPGDSLISRYRFLVHDGPVNPERTAELSAGYR